MYRGCCSGACLIGGVSSGLLEGLDHLALRTMYSASKPAASASRADIPS